MTAASEDRGVQVEKPEYIEQLSNAQREELEKFISRPNGGLMLTNRLTIEAVEGGGLLVRLKPYRAGRSRPAHFVKINLGFSQAGGEPTSWDVEECRCERPWRHAYLVS